MKKLYYIFCFILIFALSGSNKVFAAENIKPKGLCPGEYEISNPIPRGLQAISGVNFISAQIAEEIIKKEISKQPGLKNTKIRLKLYSAGDLVAGKIKSFKVTGKNIAFDDLYIKKIKAESLCKFTWLDYKSKPAVLKTPLYIKYSAEITNKELEKFFASDSVKKALTGINIYLSRLKIGKTDITEIKSFIKDEKININANLAYKNSFFSIKFPVKFKTALSVKDGKVFLSDVKFAQDDYIKKFGFITDSLTINNIFIFDSAKIKTKNSKININKIQINDKIFIDGTFWTADGIL